MSDPVGRFLDRIIDALLLLVGACVVVWMILKATELFR